MINEEVYYFNEQSISREKNKYCYPDAYKTLGYFVDDGKITYVCAGRQTYVPKKSTIDDAFRQTWLPAFLKEIEAISLIGKTSIQFTLETRDIPYYARFLTENEGFSMIMPENKAIINFREPITFSWENATFGKALKLKENVEKCENQWEYFATFAEKSYEVSLKDCDEKSIPTLEELEKEGFTLDLPYYISWENATFGKALDFKKISDENVNPRCEPISPFLATIFLAFLIVYFVVIGNRL